ncbi:MAG: alpha-L-glutamate ligase-like protein [Gammaproteobacteria bacterium]|nr:alpha-L-glutamate ligase-like protein [Gammaproteobacteria bacterium]
MLTWIRALRKRGVLGMNERNTDYIMRLNPRRLYPLVDDKLRTKELAIAAGIAVPQLYGVIRTEHDIGELATLVGSTQDFAIKPAHGSGGDGIMVVAGRSPRTPDVYRLVDGSLVNEAAIGFHLSNILAGQFSLGGHRDVALLEYCIKVDPIFSDLCFQGVPDIRVIVLRGYPIMAMIRLPTRRSRGKANLHQGAVGAGLDIASGVTTFGVLGNESAGEHPDTGTPIAGLAIPRWDYLLTLAARCYELTGLGYVGVDIVLDRQYGPLILELNARPGLNIQICNRAGLRHRAERALALPEEADIAVRVQRARESFGTAAELRAA